MSWKAPQRAVTLVWPGHDERHCDGICCPFSQKGVGGGDVAQLVEYRTITPLTQVRFPGAARDFSPRVNFSVETLLRVSLHPGAQSDTFTSVRTLKIP